MQGSCQNITRIWQQLWHWVPVILFPGGHCRAGNLPMWKLQSGRCGTGESAFALWGVDSVLILFEGQVKMAQTVARTVNDAVKKTIWTHRSITCWVESRILGLDSLSFMYFLRTPRWAFVVFFHSKIFPPLYLCCSPPSSLGSACLHRVPYNAHQADSLLGPLCWPQGQAWDWGLPANPQCPLLQP